MTLLTIAVIFNDLSQIRDLIMAGVDVNESDDNGATPLFLASRHGYLKAVQLLLADAKIDPNQSIPDTTTTTIHSPGSTPLFIACANNHMKVVNALLADSRIDPNQTTCLGSSPLHIAVINEHIEIVNTLLADPRVNPNIHRTIDGATPLCLAASRSTSTRIVDTLVACSRVTLNLPMTNGATPISIATRCGLLDNVISLVRAGADYQSLPPTITLNHALIIIENEKLKEQAAKDKEYITFLKGQISQLWFSPEPGPGYQACMSRFNKAVSSGTSELVDAELELNKYITMANITMANITMTND